MYRQAEELGYVSETDSGGVVWQDNPDEFGSPLGGGGGSQPYKEVWVDDPGVQGGGYWAINETDGRTRFYVNGIYYNSQSQLPQVAKPSGGGGNTTNVYSNPGGTPSAWFNWTDPATGDLYQINEITQEKRLIQKNTSGLINGVAEGVEQFPLDVSPTGWGIMQGGKVIPTSKTGAAYTGAGATAKAGTWTGYGPKGQGTYYLDGPNGTPGTYIGPTTASGSSSTSSASRAVSTGSSTIPRDYAGEQAASAAASAAQNTADNQAAMERLKYQTGFEGEQKALDRAIQAQRDAATAQQQQKELQRQLALDYRAALTDVNPNAVRDFLYGSGQAMTAANGGTFWNALAGGGDALTAEGVTPAAALLAQIRGGGGAATGGGLAGAQGSGGTISYGNDNIANGVPADTGAGIFGGDVPAAALTPDELAAKQAAFNDALDRWLPAPYISEGPGAISLEDAALSQAIDSGMGGFARTAAMGQSPIQTMGSGELTGAQLSQAGLPADARAETGGPGPSWNVITEPDLTRQGTVALAHGSGGLPVRSPAVVGDPSRDGVPNPEIVQWTPRGNIIQPVRGGMSGVQRMGQRMPLRMFADGGEDYGGGTVDFFRQSLANAQEQAPQPISNAGPVAAASPSTVPSPTVQPPAALPAPAPVPSPVRFDGGPITTTGGEINPVGMPGATPAPVIKPDSGSLGVFSGGDAFATTNSTAPAPVVGGLPATQTQDGGYSVATAGSGNTTVGTGQADLINEILNQRRTAIVPGLGSSYLDVAFNSIPPSQRAAWYAGMQERYGVDPADIQAEQQRYALRGYSRGGLVGAMRR